MREVTPVLSTKWRIIYVGRNHLMEDIKYSKVKTNDTRSRESRILQLLSTALVQIFQLNGVKYELIGTGFIFSRNDEFFLISAAHVFDATKEAYVYWDNKMSRLTGAIGYPKPKIPLNHSTVQKRLDFCAIRLENNFVRDELPDILVFDDSRISGKIHIQGASFIAGFLISKTKHVLGANTLHPYLFFNQLEFRTSKTSEYFVLPRYRPDGTPIPKLNGMSGAPILHIPLDETRLLLIGIGKYYVLNEDSQEILIGFEPLEMYLRHLTQR